MHASGFRAIPAGHIAARISPIARRSLHSTPCRFVGQGNGSPKPSEDSLTEQNDTDVDPEAQGNTQTSGGRQRNHGVSQRGRLAKQRAEAALPPVQLPQHFLNRNVTIFDPRNSPVLPLALAEDAKSEKEVELLALGSKPNQSSTNPSVKKAVKSYFELAIFQLLLDANRLDMDFKQTDPKKDDKWNKPSQIAEVVRISDMIIDSARHLIDARSDARHSIHKYKTRPFWWWHFHRDFDPEIGKFRDHLWPMQYAIRNQLYYAEAHDYPLAHAIADLPENTIQALRDSVSRDLLTTAPPHFDPKVSQRPITVLSLTGYGGKAIAKSVAEVTAWFAGADVVHLDASDLSVLVGQYVGQDWAYSRGPLSMLGFRAAEINGKLASDPDQASRSNEEDDDDVDSSLISVRSLASPLEEELQKKTKQRGYEIFSKWEQLKIDKVLDCIIRSPQSKTSTEQPKLVIIHLHDIVELNMTLEGSLLVSRLRALVDTAWQQGTHISILGTSSTEQPSDEYEEALKEAAVRDFVINRHIQPQRTDKSAAPRTPHKIGPFDLQRADYIDENCDNINRMIHALDPNFADKHGPFSFTTQDFELFTRTQDLTKRMLGDAILSPPEVYNVALSHLFSERVRKGNKLSTALRSLIDLGPLRQKPGQSLFPDDQESSKTDSAENSRSKRDTEADRNTSKLNEYEKRIASGQINTKDIRVTFADVHAPSETISALKLLTSLALVRPDAFSYGVLASDKIPGCLLYGPPGTGKTMLAKAVAKESGANMLEISGATINDKWVGESEKLIKAVFTLAKRLSPCVVFIDEADSLFANRSMYSNRASHREHINQFLREWDGMQETNAFIMVATNRPFDLDDAVLRRLPRKILVDLPLKEDRLAILNLLVKGEQLDNSVSLEDLAVRTPFYSGSDLKNVCVAAAMAAVEEENVAAARHTGTEPYVYPERRTLRKDHFEKALQQIPASISEDMASLKQIRKFDEEYGNRKRTSKRSMGFGIVDEKRVADATDARIRP